MTLSEASGDRTQPKFCRVGIAVPIGRFTQRVTIGNAHQTQPKFCRVGIAVPIGRFTKESQSAMPTDSTRDNER
ncbi:MAG: hypothetical protein AB4426_09855 [Xenococcaceae cyanobacterium]